MVNQLQRLSRDERVKLSVVTIFSILLFSITRVLSPISFVELGQIALGPIIIFFLFFFLRPHVAVGSLLGFSLIALGLGWWIGSDTLGWLYYIFSLPGGLMASLSMATFYKSLKNKQMTDWTILAFTSFAVIVITFLYGIIYFSFRFDYI